MVDFGSKEDLASYREEDAAKTGHAVGSRGPGGGNEKRAHGARRFMARTACKNFGTAPHACVIIEVQTLERDGELRVITAPQPPAL